MKKEIKNFGKILEVILIILTFVSLVIDLLIITNNIYTFRYDTMSLNSVVVAMPFNVLLWVTNISIYFISIFYIIDTIKEKKNVLLVTHSGVIPAICCYFKGIPKNNNIFTYHFKTCEIIKF